MSVIQIGTPESENDFQKLPSTGFVFLAIAGTLLLLVAMLSLLTYRAFTQRAPSNALIVQGDDNWSGASLRVEGVSLQRPLEATLDKANKYVVTFFLDPGIYTVYVRVGDQDLLRDNFPMRGDGETVGIDLRGSPVKPPTTGPSTQPAK
jgi:hypothetical protein